MAGLHVCKYIDKRKISDGHVMNLGCEIFRHLRLSCLRFHRMISCYITMALKYLIYFNKKKNKAKAISF